MTSLAWLCHAGALTNTRLCDLSSGWRRRHHSCRVLSVRSVLRAWPDGRRRHMTAPFPFLWLCAAPPCPALSQLILPAECALVVAVKATAQCRVTSHISVCSPSPPCLLVFRHRALFILARVTSLQSYARISTGCRRRCCGWTAGNWRRSALTSDTALLCSVCVCVFVEQRCVNGDAYVSLFVHAWAVFANSPTTIDYSEFTCVTAKCFVAAVVNYTSSSAVMRSIIHCCVLS